MSLPTVPTVTIRFGSGAGFGATFVLGSSTSGILGTNVLGTSATEFATVTNVQAISIRRGRNRELDNYDAGTATVQFLDTAGTWNPTNTSSYGTKIQPFNQVQITTVFSGTTYQLFTGYVQSWDYEWQPGTGVSRVTIQATDAFRLFSLANVTTVTGATAGEDTGSRVTDILNTISWPSSYRTIATGSVTVQADPGSTRTALAAIQNLEDTELGAFFVAGNGNATFLSRSQLSLLAAESSLTRADFRDTAGNYARYQTIDVAYDDQELANVVSVTRSGGTTQTVSDSTSINTFYTRSLSRTGLLMQTDAQALAQANSILNYRKNVRQIVNSITTDLSVDTKTASTVLNAELCDAITIVRTPVAGPTITFQSQIQSISHDITPSTWRATIGTAFPLSTAFILGSSEFGILGTSTL